MKHLLIKRCLETVCFLLFLLPLTAMAARFPYFFSQDMVIIFTTDNKPVAIRSTSIDSSRSLPADASLKISYNKIPGHDNPSGETVHFKTIANCKSQWHKATVFVVEVPDLASTEPIRIEQTGGEVPVPLATAWTIGELKTTQKETGEEKASKFVFLKKTEQKTDVFFCFPRDSESSKVARLELGDIQEKQQDNGFTVQRKELINHNLVYFSTGCAPIKQKANERYEEDSSPTTIEFLPISKTELPISLWETEESDMGSDEEEEEESEDEDSEKNSRKAESSVHPDSFFPRIHVSFIPGVTGETEGYTFITELTVMASGNPETLKKRIFVTETWGHDYPSRIDATAISILSTSRGKDIIPEHRGFRILSREFIQSHSGQYPCFHTVQIKDSEYQHIIIDAQEQQTPVRIYFRITASSTWWQFIMERARSAYAITPVSPEFTLLQEQLTRPSPKLYVSTPHYQLWYQTAEQTKTQKLTERLTEVQKENETQKRKLAEKESTKKQIEQLSKDMQDIKTSIQNKPKS